MSLAVKFKRRWAFALAFLCLMVVCVYGLIMLKFLWSSYSSPLGVNNNAISVVALNANVIFEGNNHAIHAIAKTEKPHSSNINIDLVANHIDGSNIDIDWANSLKYSQMNIKDKSSFFGEKGAIKFKKHLIQWLNKLDDDGNDKHDNNTTEIEMINIVDIGANIGQIFGNEWSVHKYKFCFLLFEANPMLLHNISLSAEQFITANSKYRMNIHYRMFNYAFANERNENMIFRLHKEVSEWSQLVYPSQPEPEKKQTQDSDTDDEYEDISINTTTLDDIFVDLDLTLDFISSFFNLLKIDTEGSDVLVLFGAKHVIKQFDVILYECHRLQLTTSKTSFFIASMFFEKYSFDSYKLGKHFNLPLMLKYYHPTYDQARYMGWQNCVAINRQSRFYLQLTNILMPQKLL